MAPKKKKDVNETTQELLVEDLVRRGWIVRPLPPEVLSELQEAHEDNPSIPCWPAIRLNKLTHKMRTQIAAEVARRYNADLRDQTLLSNAELLKLTEARGEWTSEDARRVSELQQRVGELMRTLTMGSIEEQQAWAPQMTKLYESMLAVLKDKHPDQVELFERWANYTVALQTLYDALYSEEQGSDHYDPDRDFRALAEQVPMGMMDQLTELEGYTQRLQLFLELQDQQNELNGLLQRQGKSFSQSIENRRDAAESLVRITHVGQWVDADGASQGNIDNPEDLPEAVLEWVLLEAHFFLQNIPPETREYLQQWGFLPAPQARGSSASSDESPVEQSSSSDSTVSNVTPAASSEQLTLTTSANPS